MSAVSKRTCRSVFNADQSEALELEGLTYGRNRTPKFVTSSRIGGSRSPGVDAVTDELQQLHRDFIDELGALHAPIGTEDTVFPFRAGPAPPLCCASGPHLHCTQSQAARRSRCSWSSDGQSGACRRR